MLLALCIFGEARGESAAAQRAVAQVVVNRAQFAHPVFGSRRDADFAENLRRVILKPKQFSCFLTSDPNCAKLLHPLDWEHPETWQRCLETAREALASRHQQDTLTLNSDHYFDQSIQPPTWADPSRATVIIGRLRFYRLYLPPSEAEAGARRNASGRFVGPQAGAPPSRRESSPPERPRRVRRPSRSSIAGATTAALRRERFGSGPMSFPASHHPSQRTPRLGPNRWWSRGLSSPLGGSRRAAKRGAQRLDAVPRRADERAAQECAQHLAALGMTAAGERGMENLLSLTQHGRMAHAL